MKQEIDFEDEKEEKMFNRKPLIIFFVVLLIIIGVVTFCVVNGIPGYKTSTTLIDGKTSETLVMNVDYDVSTYRQPGKMFLTVTAFPEYISEIEVRFQLKNDDTIIFSDSQSYDERINYNDSKTFEFDYSSVDDGDTFEIHYSILAIKNS